MIFDNGDLFGTDESNLRAHYAAYVQSKQDLYRSLVNGLDSGQPIDKLLHTAEGNFAAAAEAPGFDFRNPLALYPREALADVRLWQREYGDTALGGILKQALRSDPFLIRAQST